MLARLLVVIALVASGIGVALSQGAMEPAAASPIRVLGSLEARELGVGGFAGPADAIDLLGTPHSWRDCAGALGTVIVATDAKCPFSRAAATEVARLEALWRERGVAFVHLFVGAATSIADARAFVEFHGLAGPALIDQDANVADVFDLRQTTEIVLVDRASTIRWRGGVCNGADQSAAATLAAPLLARALENLVRGGDAIVPSTTASGTLLAKRAEARAVEVTYTRQIARLVGTSCAPCHLEGGSAPFALTDYEAVSRRAAMISAVFSEGLMPPWGARVASTAHAFANDRSLSSRERREFDAWLAADKPRGDIGDAPQLRSAESNGWQAGAPDLICAIAEPFAVPAEGPTLLRKFVVATGLERDRWISALEVRPTDARVVHHVLIYTLRKQPSGAPPPESFIDSDTDYHYLTAWAPGVGALIEPPDHAIRLPCDRDLVMDVHYTPNGRATIDRTAIGLHFADDTPAWKPERAVRTAIIASEEIDIPPGVAAHEERAVGIFTRSARVRALAGHMHYRGAVCEVVHVDAAGRRTTLLDIPRFEFDWQFRYERVEPFDVPAGTMLEVIGHYDNSSSNLDNPDPTARVKFGNDSTDEMLMAFVDYVLVDEDAYVEDQYGPVLVLPGAVADLIVALDVDAGGSILRAEVPEYWLANFDRVDLNHDGVVDRTEVPLLARPEH